MPDAQRGDVDDAVTVKRQRLALYARVLEMQRSFYESWGRWPTVEEVAQAIGG